MSGCVLLFSFLDVETCWDHFLRAGCRWFQCYLRGRSWIIYSTFFGIPSPCFLPSHSPSHMFFSLLWICLGLCLALLENLLLDWFSVFSSFKNALVPAFLFTEGLKQDVMSVYVGVGGLGIFRIRFFQICLEWLSLKVTLSCLHVTMGNTSSDNLRLSGLLHRDQVMLIM